jgi:hypothetical protein
MRLIANTMRRTVGQIVLALALVAGIVYWATPAGNVAAAPEPDRKTVLTDLRLSLTHAMDNASFDAQQKSQLAAARKILRQAEAARQKNQPVDADQVREARNELRQLMKSDAVHGNDRASIQRGIQQLHEVDQLEAVRKRQVRRDTLVQQLGYPIGILADLASEKM